MEPVTYTWCHGPAGTSLLFAALAHAGVGRGERRCEVAALRDRCLHSVLTSGVPERLRPGFWDNDGRCCGTAGVGDVLLDAAQDTTDPARADLFLGWAGTMGDALVERAVRDDAGARWRFLEHRQDPPLLPPGTSWMQGAAGIAAYLLRLARVLEDGLDRSGGGPPRPVVGGPVADSHRPRHGRTGGPGLSPGRACGGWDQAVGSGRSSRTSCAQRHATAILAAHSSASSRDGTSTTANPPRTSLVSG